MTSYFRRVWLSLGLVALLAVSWTQSYKLRLTHERGLLPISPPTPYVRYLAQPEPRARMLVVHGLDSSKEFMQIFSSAMAEGGFDVYTIDLPGHGDSPIGFEATTAEKAVENALTHLGNNTIVAGHSLGAGLLLDLATKRRFETMVLLSPPPTPIGGIDVGRLLVVTGDWDMPRINAFIPILKDIGGSHVEWWRLPWAAHSSAVLNPGQIADILKWLGGDSEHLQTNFRLIWLVIQLVSSVVLGICLFPGSAIVPRRYSSKNALLLYAAAGSAALVILKFVVVMTWLRLFATDYLISFLLVFGLLLWSLSGIQERKRGTSRGLRGLRRSNPRNPCNPRLALSIPWIHAIAAAAYVIVVIGIISGSQLFHFTLTNGRWWRFPFIAAAGFPIFAMDECVLRRMYPRWKAACFGFLTRTLMGAFVATGVLILNPHYAFLVLIIHLVILFWMLLWFATELVHRHTQNAVAAALFAAIVQGWAFAALFVTI